MSLIASPDKTVHYSALKAMARSPRHYVHACTKQTEPTRAMRVGTAVHARVLGTRPGQRLAVWEGKTRNDKGYKDWAARQEGAEILTQPEWLDAEGPAEAVLADPVARTILGLRNDTDATISSIAHSTACEIGAMMTHTGNPVRYEVPLTWTDNGIPYSTSGIDIIGPGYIAELKTTTNAEPEHFQRHAIKMLYNAQLAHYRMGCAASAVHYSADHLDGVPWVPKDLYIIAVEVDPPHCVTVLQLTPEVIDHGERCVRAWQERLKVCADSGVYPGYSQSVVPFALPEWMAEMEGFDE